MKYRVLYFSQAPWKVGERQTDRDARLRSKGPADLRDIYPDQFPGRVISVIPAWKEYSPGDTADPARAVVTLDLTDEERSDLASRRSKVVLGVLGALAVRAVSFDERHGVRAAALKEAFPLDFAVREEEEQAEILAAHERNDLALQVFKEDLAAWQEEKLSAAEIGLVLETPRPAAPNYEPVPEPEFADLADRLARALPATEAHTGAGLYKVDDDGSVHNDTIASFNDNLLLESERLGSAVWTTVDVSVLADLIAGPNGAITADKLVEGTGAGQHYILQEGSVTNGVSYTISGRAKATERTWLALYHTGTSSSGKYFDLGNGVVGNDIGTIADSGIIDEGGGWYRCWFRYIAAATESHNIVAYVSQANQASYQGDGASGIYLVGLQLRQESDIGTYLPTRASGDTQITLTTGGFTDPDRDGEVFISGGNSYAVIRNGTDSVLVVGDATGEAGACTVSPYTTMQSFIDQLWSDQGSANFTATQEGRIWDGTYTEAIGLPATFKPMWNFPLVIRAATGETAVIVTNSGIADHTFNLAYTPRVLFEGVEIKTEVAVKHALYLPGHNCEMEDCIIRTTGNGKCFEAGRAFGFTCRDSTFIAAGTDYFINYPHSYERCVFRGGKILDVGGNSAFRGCTFDSTHIVTWPIITNSNPPGRPLELLNCTAYNMSGDFIESQVHNLNDYLLVRLRNCIIHTVGGYVFDAGAGGANKGGILVDSDRNCFYNCTKIARVDGIDYADLAAWQALTDDWGCSPDAASQEADPKLTDPAGDDFSLAADSPCRRAGVGVGLTGDLNGDAWHPQHPDQGAVSSSGTADSAAPTFTVADDETGTSFTVTVAAGDAADEVFVEYAAAGDAAWTEFGSTRKGSGALQVTGVAEKGYKVQVVACRNRSSTACGAARSLVKGVLVTSGSSDEKKAVAALCAELEDSLSLKVVHPWSRFDPQADGLTEYVDVGLPRFGASGGRAGPERAAFACDLLVVSEQKGDSRDLGRTWELAGQVAALLRDADLEVEAGKLLDLRKPAREVVYEEDEVQAVQVTVEGFYVRN